MMELTLTLNGQELWVRRIERTWMDRDTALEEARAEITKWSRPKYSLKIEAEDPENFCTLSEDLAVFLDDKKTEDIYDNISRCFRSFRRDMEEE